jgi:VanZ family protein
MIRLQIQKTACRSALLEPRRRSVWTLALGGVLAVYAICLCGGTHTPLAHLPITIHNDVLYHFAAYFVLAMMVFLVLYQRASRTRAVSMEHVLSTCLVACAAACMFGVLDEVTQPFVGRHFQWKDISADFFGAALGATAMFFAVALLTVFSRKRRGGREK